MTVVLLSDSSPDGGKGPSSKAGATGTRGQGGASFNRARRKRFNRQKCRKLPETPYPLEVRDLDRAQPGARGPHEASVRGRLEQTGRAGRMIADAA